MLRSAVLCYVVALYRTVLQWIVFYAMLCYDRLFSCVRFYSSVVYCTPLYVLQLRLGDHVHNATGDGDVSAFSESQDHNHSAQAAVLDRYRAVKLSSSVEGEDSLIQVRLKGLLPAWECCKPVASERCMLQLASAAIRHHRRR